MNNASVIKSPLPAKLEIRVKNKYKKDSVHNTLEVRNSWPRFWQTSIRQKEGGALLTKHPGNGDQGQPPCRWGFRQVRPSFSRAVLCPLMPPCSPWGAAAEGMGVLSWGQIGGVGAGVFMEPHSLSPWSWGCCLHLGRWHSDPAKEWTIHRRH